MLKQVKCTLNPVACMYVCMYVCRFQNVVLRCPTPRLHCCLSSHWPSFSFLSFMAFLIPSIQFFFGLPLAVFCFGIHFSAILGNLPSAILWTWPYVLFHTASFIKQCITTAVFCLKSVHAKSCRPNTHNEHSLQL